MIFFTPTYRSSLKPIHLFDLWLSLHTWDIYFVKTTFFETGNSETDISTKSGSRFFYHHITLFLYLCRGESKINRNSELM